VRFLIDQCVSPGVAAGLRDAGHDAVHVRERGLAGAEDAALFALAAAEDRVVLTADGDFSELLADRNAAGPSVVYLRHDAPAAAAGVVKLVVDNLEALDPHLAAGALVVVRRDRLRVRRLPLFPPGRGADGE